MDVVFTVHDSVAGVMVSIVAFQAVDPGSIPGPRIQSFFRSLDKETHECGQLNRATHNSLLTFAGCKFHVKQKKSTRDEDRTRDLVRVRHA